MTVTGDSGTEDDNEPLYYYPVEFTCRSEGQLLSQMCPDDYGYAVDGYPRCFDVVLSRKFSSEFAQEPLTNATLEWDCHSCGYMTNSSEYRASDGRCGGTQNHPPACEPAPPSQHKRSQPANAQTSSCSPNKSPNSKERQCELDKIVNNLLLSAAPQILDIIEKELESLGGGEGSRHNEGTVSESAEQASQEATGDALRGFQCHSPGYEERRGDCRSVSG